MHRSFANRVSTRFTCRGAEADVGGEASATRTEDGKGAHWIWGNYWTGGAMPHLDGMLRILEPKLEHGNLLRGGQATPVAVL